NVANKEAGTSKAFGVPGTVVWKSGVLSPYTLSRRTGRIGFGKLSSISTTRRPARSGKFRPAPANRACRSDCMPDRAPTGLGLRGTKWENYRLHGEQIDFI